MSGQFVTAILLAAGKGERTGQPTPKQFLDLAGNPLLVHSLHTLDSSPEISSVVLVLPSDHPSYLDEPPMAAKLDSIAIGGDLRQDSLAQGMVCLPDPTELVLIHDAARPLLSLELISRAIGALEPPFSGAVCGLPVEDALKEVSSDNEVIGFRSKRSLWRAQTPQVFDRGPIEEAIARLAISGDVVEDCSEMLTRAGYQVKAVPGDPWNVKVTRAADIGLCERILEARTGRRNA